MIIFCHQFGREVGYALCADGELTCWTRFLKLTYLTGHTLEPNKRFWRHLIPKEQGTLTIWEFSDKPFNLDDLEPHKYFHVAHGAIADLITLSLDKLADMIKNPVNFNIVAEFKPTDVYKPGLGITISSGE